MKVKTIAFIFLSFITLGTTSCSKDPSIDNYYSLFTDSGSPSSGDDKKIDIKGSLMNGDMKHPNLEAWLSENTLYVKFNETIENCMILVTTSGGRVVFSRRVDKQYSTTIRIYMGGKPSDTYHLHITDGCREAEGEFWLSNN